MLKLSDAMWTMGIAKTVVLGYNAYQNAVRKLYDVESSIIL